MIMDNFYKASLEIHGARQYGFELTQNRKGVA